MKATLILANGQTFVGESIGCVEDKVFQLVFNTSMVGYQEILTDPACAGQGVVMSYPLIGNYGVNMEDNESDHIWAEGFVIRCMAHRGSNFRNEGDLNSYLKQHHITGICGVDTRALTKILRNEGTMNAMITCAEHFHSSEVMERLKAYKVTGKVSAVTCTEAKEYPAKNGAYKVALLDLGAKRTLIEGLNAAGCTVVRLPAGTSAEEILSGGYDGLVVSNGPGCPCENEGVIACVKAVMAAGLPTFGCGLGHSIMALAMGGAVEQLPYGHHGANQPVRCIATGRVHIAGENQLYAVKADSLTDVAEVSFVNINDKSCAGLVYKTCPAFSVQFHPESDPGPVATFGKFAELIANVKNGGAN